MGNRSSSKNKQEKSKKQKKLNHKEINKNIQRLYDFEDMLHKKIEFIESQADKEINNARRHGKKNRRGRKSLCTIILQGHYGYM